MNGELQSRRNFLRTLIGGVTAAAAVRTFPFRVFSFPTEIATPTIDGILLSQQQPFGIDLAGGYFHAPFEWDFYIVSAETKIKGQHLFNL